jgi:uncharacterized membrane protein
MLLFHLTMLILNVALFGILFFAGNPFWLLNVLGSLTSAYCLREILREVATK